MGLLKKQCNGMAGKNVFSMGGNSFQARDGGGE